MKEKISIVSNLWIKEVVLEKKGDVMEGHSHKFDHQHLLAVGSIKLYIEGVLEPTVFTAPQVIFVPKETLHSFEALTDTTLGYCIHAIRNGLRVEDIVYPKMRLKTDEGHWPEAQEDTITELVDSIESWSHLKGV